MASAKESLVRLLEQLYEEEARRVLELIGMREARLPWSKETPSTREILIQRLAGKPGFRVPEPNAPPFRKFVPIECPGIPASKLLITDRR